MKQPSGLSEAVEAGELQSVRTLLDQGADTEVIDDNGLTPLQLAAYLGHRDIVTALVSAGADIHARDRFGRTPLMHAVFSGHTSIVVYLLLNGADPQAHSDKWSALELAAIMNHQQLTLLLELASHADLKYVRRLARSLASSPSNPSESADRLVVTRLLEEKGHDTQFEPLVTAFLQEIRSERPKPRYRPTSRSAALARADQALPASQSLDSRRAARFVGVPPETVSVGSSWTVSGSDDSVLREDVYAFEESGQISAIINRAVGELHLVALEDSVSALDRFNEYFRRIGATAKGESSDFQRTLRAALMLYTDDRFFRVLNACWRSNRSRDLLGFSTLMSMAFRHAPYFLGGEVYRGVDLADVDHYLPGLVFRWPFFISASKNRNVATEFGKTLFVIEVPTSANVREIEYSSLFPEEGEVLFRAYEVFEVLEVGPVEIRVRVFYDEYFGTGMELTEQNEIRPIE